MEKATKGSAELVEVNRELFKAISTGTVLIGSKETIKACKERAAKCGTTHLRLSGEQS
jgi:ribosomal protein L30E